MSEPGEQESVDSEDSDLPWNLEGPTKPVESELTAETALTVIARRRVHEVGVSPTNCISWSITIISSCFMTSEGGGTWHNKYPPPWSDIVPSWLTRWERHRGLLWGIYEREANGVVLEAHKSIPIAQEVFRGISLLTCSLPKGVTDICRG